ncbi:MAG: RuBisCO large subunit C-terminal-like domain-containing protein [Thermoguttaceae bacterium]
MNPTPRLNLSGDRFLAVYHLAGPRDEALARAEDICLEQTVEYPEDLIPRQDIRDQILGRVASFEPVDHDRFEARIEFPIETAGSELPQLLNVLFGNISIKPGYRLVAFDLPQQLLRHFRGPRFGRPGLRQLLGVYDRPLLSTAIKPMGLSPGELADYARQFALGGIDLIKDDHGLADQPFCRFEERVQRIADAVRQANDETGFRCLYAPNITAPADQLLDRARIARQAGAAGCLVSPGLVGFDAMRRVADDDPSDLAVLCHPALLGSFTISPTGGIAHGALYGQICRLAGADVVIFPNYGGRFSFSQDECRDILRATSSPMGHLPPIFPSPAGGMKLERVPDLCRFYGNDSVLLIGGDLHRHGPNLADNCRRLADLVRQHGEWPR